MAQYRVLVVVGSLRRESFNRQLAQALEKALPWDFSFEYANLADLPLYNQDDDGQQAPAVIALKEQLRAASGVLFVTPEYNRSIPGVLKNAIDHASRPYGDSAWAGKPAGVIGVSVGTLGTALAQTHLRSILAYLGMPLLPGNEGFLRATEGLFAADGSLGPDSADFLQSWLGAFVDWVRKHA